MSRPPLSLSDEQLDAVLHAARPLPVEDRDAFLQQVAMALQDQPIGDGSVHRVVKQVQRQFWNPRDLSRARDQSKYR
jgi:hypothetical protein